MTPVFRETSYVLSTLFTTKLQTATTSNNHHIATMQPNPPICDDKDISTFRIGMKRQQSPFKMQSTRPLPMATAMTNGMEIAEYPMYPMNIMGDVLEQHTK